MKVRKRMKQIAITLVVAAVVWSTFVGFLIWNFGLRNDAIPADCIIVLGAAVQGAAPSPVFAERIRHGISLYRAGYAEKLLFTGGIGSRTQHSEGKVGQAEAIRQAIPAANILYEEQSHTTLQNLTEAASVMQKNHLRTAIIVSDPLHMKRATMMAQKLGMRTVSSPTPTSKYRSLPKKLLFLVREIFFVHYFVVTGG